MKLNKLDAMITVFPCLVVTPPIVTADCSINRAGTVFQFPKNQIHGWQSKTRRLIMTTESLFHGQAQLQNDGLGNLCVVYCVVAQFDWFSVAGGTSVK